MEEQPLYRTHKQNREIMAGYLVTKSKFNYRFYTTD